MNIRRRVRGFFIRQGWVRPRVVTVCTGNTCRSPLAEAILKSKFDLAEVDSCGTAAQPGDAAAEHSVTVARARYGIWLDSHSARPAREVITPGHFDYAVAMSTNHEAMIHRLDPGLPVAVINVSDPYGSSLPKYEHTAKEIESSLEHDALLSRFARA